MKLIPIDSIVLNKKDNHIYIVKSYKLDRNFVFIEDPFEPIYCNTILAEHLTLLPCSTLENINSQKEFRQQYPEYFI